MPEIYFLQIFANAQVAVKLIQMILYVIIPENNFSQSWARLLS